MCQRDLAGDDRVASGHVRLRGFIGGTAIIVAFALVLFSVIDSGSPAQALFSLPEMVWEAGLPIYCIWKGFRPSPITETVDVRGSAAEPSMAAV